MPDRDLPQATAADIAAMAFTHPTDLATAAAQASRFAGPGGRLATLPDVIDARLATAPGQAAWEYGITTSSAEYAGLSAGGTAIIVVAHGCGPLADPEGSPDAFIRKETGGREWRLSKEAFIALAEGFYGPVTVVDMRQALHRRKHPFTEMLGHEQAGEDPLVRARLGIRAQDFLDRHLELSKDWLRDNDRPGYGNSSLMSHRDAVRSPYACADLETPMAHPLEISPLIIYRHTHWAKPTDHESLVTEVSCHERGERARVVGIRERVRLKEIFPPVPPACKKR